MAKKKPGRPPKDPSERREATVRIRVTAVERERLEKAARAEGMNLSAWARGRLLESTPE